MFFWVHMRFLWHKTELAKQKILSATFLIRYPKNINSKFLVELFNLRHSNVPFQGWQYWKKVCDFFEFSQRPQVNLTITVSTKRDQMFSTPCAKDINSRWAAPRLQKSAGLPLKNQTACNPVITTTLPVRSKDCRLSECFDALSICHLEFRSKAKWNCFVCSSRVSSPAVPGWYWISKLVTWIALKFGPTEKVS